MECCCQDSDLLTRVSEISDIVLAVATLLLAYYVFVYQRGKDKLSNKLLWFKELIIEPNKSLIYEFFDKMVELSNEFKTDELTDLKKCEILSRIKSNCSFFRRNFIVLLYSGDHKLGKEAQNCVDLVLDQITVAAFDPNYNLADESEFEMRIESKIYDAKNLLFSMIFKYEG